MPPRDDPDETAGRAIYRKRAEGEAAFAMRRRRLVTWTGQEDRASCPIVSARNPT